MSLITKNTPTILIVDDNKSNIDILLELLNGYDLVPCIDGYKAIDIALEDDIDLILLDIMMPNIDGFEICKILKSNKKTKDIPILFITANTDDESMKKSFEVGGVDYITKPFKSFELQARVKTHIHLHETLKSLDYLATRDFMTGIYNRRKFFELANELYDTSNNIFIIMIDIDKFKNINDTYGHAFGDRVIKSITKTISKQLNTSDIFARFGGEEFIIMCKANSIDEITKKTELIRKSIENLEEQINKKIIKFTISNGIAQKKQNESIDELLQRADEALYDAKGSGRNKVCFRI